MMCKHPLQQQEEEQEEQKQEQHVGMTKGTTPTIETLRSSTCTKRLVHPLVIAAVIPLCPPWFFIGRGYTQWFHWCCLFYYLCSSSSTSNSSRHLGLRFLVLQGLGVCFGWYFAVIHDLVVNGRAFDLLYNNMPPAVRDSVRNGETGALDYTTLRSLGMMAVAHVVDILFHPYITYKLYHLYASKLHSTTATTFHHLLQSWDAWIYAFAFCRFYNWFHAVINQNAYTCFWYYGYDLYVVDTLDSWTWAHIGESFIFMLLALAKLCSATGIAAAAAAAAATASTSTNTSTNHLQKQTRKHPNNNQSSTALPQLIKSESCVSNNH